jgi:hypothetical protein
MAGVLERIRWPQKKLVVGHSYVALSKVDLRVLELQAAKEILAEIFVRNSDVEEMIHNRYSEISYAKTGYEETEHGPECSCWTNRVPPYVSLFSFPYT